MTKAKTAKKSKALTLFEAARNVFAYLTADEKEKIVKEFTPKPLKEEKAAAQKPKTKKTKAAVKKVAKKKKPTKAAGSPRKMTRANGSTGSASAAA